METAAKQQHGNTMCQSGLPGECQHLVKVIFCGTAGVGKTCLMARLFGDKFMAASQPTIGCDFQFKQYKIDDKSIGVTLWDTAGSERFAAMTTSYFRGAHGIILVYDVTRRETLDALERQWLPEVAAHATLPNAIKLIVGNKVDLADKRQVTPEEGAAFARRHGCLYQETSAAAQDNSVHDALVWGLLVNIVDNEQLLRSYDHDKLQLERRPHSGGGSKQNNGCC